MNSNLARILIPIAVIILLNMAGIVDLSVLPWNDTDFQATLATVVLYLLWSVIENTGKTDTSRITLYAVLLVSVLDAFLLRITAFSGFMFLRWAGVAILAAGCSMRIYSTKTAKNNTAEYGRIGQMIGLALGLGSIVGTAIAFFPGIPSALKEKT